MPSDKPLSASQFKTFSSCERKWGWEKLAGLPSPPNLGAALGSRVHEILEALLRDGSPIDITERWTWDNDPKQKKYYPGAIASTMVGPHLPKPGTALIERRFLWQDVTHGISWLGYIDVDASTENHARIIDHKTSSDTVKFGHNDSTLKHDPQAILYALASGDKHSYEVLFNYGGRAARKREARVVTAKWSSRQELFASYEKDIVPRAKKMLRLYKEAPHPKSLSPNTSMCSVYGGCPYRDNCDLSVADKIGALMNKKRSLLADALDEDLDEDLDVVEEEEEEESPPVEEEKPKKKSKAQALLDDEPIEVEEPPPPPSPSKARKARKARKNPAPKRNKPTVNPVESEPEEQETTAEEPRDEVDASELAALIVDHLIARVRELLK